MKPFPFWPKDEIIEDIERIPQYPNIERGTSLQIPILMTLVDDSPFDNSDFELYFTMKKSLWDYDYHDSRIYIQKVVTPHPTYAGRFDVNLTSKDTWLPPGKYYFDLEIKNKVDGAVARLKKFWFNLVAGPTNSTINPGDGHIILGDAIRHKLLETHIITFVSPLITDPPMHLVETITAAPTYLLDNLDPRNPKIVGKSEQKVSLSMSFEDPNDSTYRDYIVQAPYLPPDFPLIGFRIRHKWLTLLFDANWPSANPIHLLNSYIYKEPSNVVRYNAQTNFNQGIDITLLEDTIWGSLNIHQKGLNDSYIKINGEYTLPRETTSPSLWTFDISYWGW